MVIGFQFEDSPLDHVYIPSLLASFKPTYDQVSGSLSNEVSAEDDQRFFLAQLYSSMSLIVIKWPPSALALDSPCVQLDASTNV